MSTEDVTLWSTRGDATPPVMVEAIHLTHDIDWWATAWWCHGTLTEGQDDAGHTEVSITVQTINGPQAGRLGDYIVHRGPGVFEVWGAENFLFTFQLCDEDGDPV